MSSRVTRWDSSLTKTCLLTSGVVVAVNTLRKDIVVTYSACVDDKDPFDVDTEASKFSIKTTITNSGNPIFLS